MKIDFESINQFSALQKRLAYERTDDLDTGHYVYEFSFQPLQGTVRLHCQFKLLQETIAQLTKSGGVVPTSVTVLDKNARYATVHLDCTVGNVVLAAILERSELYQMLQELGLDKTELPSHDVDELFWLWQSKTQWCEEGINHG